MHQITNIIGEGPITIGGINFIIHQTAEAFDIEIPEINAVYTHMLGHDCHSIVAGAAHADAIIDQLEGYIAKGYDLILTSHYTPRGSQGRSSQDCLYPGAKKDCCRLREC